VGKSNQAHDVFRKIDMTGGPEACWPWKGGMYNQRPYFEYQKQKRLAYRIVYELTYGVELDTGTMLLHSCDNSWCCNPAHLRPGTHQENMDDMVERDRHGIPHHAVRGIRHLLETTELSKAAIGRMYGVSRETVSAIAHGRRRSKVE
jgi:hypothetical protein